MKIKKKINVYLRLKLECEQELNGHEFVEMFSDTPDKEILALGHLAKEKVASMSYDDIEEALDVWESSPPELLTVYEHEVWTKEDSIQAVTEGWDVFHNGFVYQIQRLDEAEIFDEDFRAIKFVCRKAEAGSELHKKALIIHLSN
ncbi:hypothetical protein OsccyDRAFT_0602 [Leptolyngbyaceae cyanobacterium JSC-12]|nr:hypothetical protein OsccyDRAFT_0602 [Leptolyngbyaceae cyanobacterium JSC-12]